MAADGPERARRRFYLAAPDFRHDPSDYSFVNKDEALVRGRTAGMHEHRVEGFADVTRIGLPPLEEKPRLVVGATSDVPIDVYGFGPRFISTRAHDLLSALDAEAFEFADCGTVDGNGIGIPPYWMMDVSRMVRSFDEKRSNFERYADIYPMDPTASENSSILRLNDIHMAEDLPAEFHAFYLLRYRSDFIFDEVIVDAWREKGFTGLAFTPLQPPTPGDRDSGDHFVNFPYWQSNIQS